MPDDADTVCFTISSWRVPMTSSSEFRIYEPFLNIFCRLRVFADDLDVMAMVNSCHWPLAIATLTYHKADFVAIEFGQQKV